MVLQPQPDDFDGGGYLAANPDVAANSYFAVHPYAHYQQFGVNEGRDYTKIMQPTLSQSFGGAPADTGAFTGTQGTGGRVYIPGHGYVGGAQNIRKTIQGYDPNYYQENYGATSSGYGDSAYLNNDGLHFTQNEGGWYDGSDGGKYDSFNEGYFLDPATGKWTNVPEGGGYRRRNDALTTYKNEMGRINEGWNYEAGDNFEMDRDSNLHTDWVDQTSGRIKTGEKSAHRIMWKLNPATNTWDPQVTGQEGWDTNKDERMRLQMIIAMASMGAGAYLAPAAAAAGTVEAGAVAGASEAALGTGGLWEGVATGITSGAGGGTAAGAAGGGFLDTLKQGYDLYKQGNQAYKAYGQLQNLLGGGGSGGGQVGGARSQMPGAAGGGSGMGWLDQLFNMGGAMYSANKNDNYADELRQERARSLAERQPFLDRVGQLSGDAGAENFRNGGTWDAAERVASNRFTRNDAAKGRLSNDTDRQRLLQDHFMGKLGEERTSARNDLNAFDEKASRDAFMKGLEMDRMKNSPLFAGAAYGQGGGAGTLGGMSPQIIDALKQIPGGIQYLSQLMGGGGGAMDPTSSWGSEIFAPGASPDYGMGGVFEGDFPVSDWANDGGIDASWLDF